MLTFRFHWLDGRKETGKGANVADAFAKLGYSQGALAALDFWEQI